MPGNSSLAIFLTERRGARTLACLPRFSVKQVLAWADSHFETTGKWPKDTSGFIHQARGDKWKMVDAALRLGLRGLPGGSSLARLLAEQRGVRNIHGLKPITEAMILKWADRFHNRTGKWPIRKSGAILEANDETTWRAADTALQLGRRGLPGGSSLARLLAAHRGVPNLKQRPSLTIAQVLSWARAYYRREGRWPPYDAGPVQECPDTTWRAIATALNEGLRGLPAGISLARFLREHGPRKGSRKCVAV
jgi:hypothetical protein